MQAADEDNESRMVQLTYPGGPYTIDPKNDVKTV